MPVTGLENTNRGARGDSLLMLSLMRLSNRKPPLLSESESGGSMSLTNPESDAIVGIDKTGPQVRKGKAMLQRHTLNTRSIYRPYDLQGIIMPSTDKVERFNKACLAKAGLSGYLGPGVSIRIPG